MIPKALSRLSIANVAFAIDPAVAVVHLSTSALVALDVCDRLSAAVTASLTTAGATGGAGGDAMVYNY